MSRFSNNIPLAASCRISSNINIECSLNILSSLSNSVCINFINFSESSFFASFLATLLLVAKIPASEISSPKSAMNLSNMSETSSSFINFVSLSSENIFIPAVSNCSNSLVISSSVKVAGSRANSLIKGAKPSSIIILALSISS